jgi:hypothetical protein
MLANFHFGHVLCVNSVSRGGGEREEGRGEEGKRGRGEEGRGKRGKREDGGEEERIFSRQVSPLQCFELFISIT